MNKMLMLFTLAVLLGVPSMAKATCIFLGCSYCIAVSPCSPCDTQCCLYNCNGRAICFPQSCCICTDHK
jgi:hypothetical protein